MKVMIANSEASSKLAAHLHTLIEHISGGALEVWHSAALRAEGQNDYETWQQAIRRKLDDTGAAIVLWTDDAHTDPWLSWECSFAQAVLHDTTMWILLHNTALSALQGPLGSLAHRRADDPNHLREIAEAILSHAGGVSFDRERFDRHLGPYLHAIAHEPAGATAPSGPALDGLWHCTWYDEQDQPFVRDTWEVIPSATSIRLIGYDGKGWDGINYWFGEGRLSEEGILTFTYWVGSGFALTGSVVLRYDPASDSLTGQWTGYTTENQDDESMRFVSGRVSWERAPA